MSFQFIHIANNLLASLKIAALGLELWVKPYPTASWHALAIFETVNVAGFGPPLRAFS